MLHRPAPSFSGSDPVPVPVPVPFCSPTAAANGRRGRPVSITERRRSMKMLLIAAAVLLSGPTQVGPPPEAVEACVNRQTGDLCTVTLPEQQLEGKCRLAPSGEALVCVPPHPPPPREAVVACSGRS